MSERLPLLTPYHPPTGTNRNSSRQVRQPESTNLGPMSLSTSDPYLSRALELLLKNLPKSPALWVKPPSGTRIPCADSSFYQPWYPEHQRLLKDGNTAWTPGSEFSNAVVFGGRHKEENVQLVEACRSHGPVHFLIPNEYGAKSYRKLFEGALEEEEVGRKSRLMRLRQSKDSQPKPLVEYSETLPGFVSTPGLFCWDKPDKGSELLAQALAEQELKGPVLDLGAGWGYLCKNLPEELELHLVEADSRGVEACRRNLSGRPATYHWADATEPATLPANLLNGMHTVITNPPFHTHKQAEPILGGAFVANAHRFLRKGGRFYMVGNVHLGYFKLLETFFQDVKELSRANGFSVFGAVKR